MQIIAITVLKDIRNVFYSGSPHMRESGFQNLGKFRLWNPESEKIRNPGLWNLEYSSRNPESEIQVPQQRIWNPVPGTRNP